MPIIKSHPVIDLLFAVSLKLWGSRPKVIFCVHGTWKCMMQDMLFIVHYVGEWSACCVVGRPARWVSFCRSTRSPSTPRRNRGRGTRRRASRLLISVLWTPVVRCQPCPPLDRPHNEVRARRQHAELVELSLYLLFTNTLTLSVRTVEISRIFLLNEKQYF